MAVFGGSVVVIAAVSSQFLSVHCKSECYAKSQVLPSSCVGFKKSHPPSPFLKEMFSFKEGEHFILRLNIVLRSFKGSQPLFLNK